MPTDWEWWYGHIDAESYAEPFETKAQAIAAGLRDTTPGDQFQIIEARSSTAQKYETGSHDVIPFTRTRNHQIITNGPVL